ncbi:MAG TPA: porin [Hyphomonadaceae bacterium]|nr:porin [Hyphomonadaceae bacterium]HPN06624.1 porin [Hyphomonadaceae bacterium]
MRRSFTLAILGTGAAFGTALPAFAQAADGEWAFGLEATATGAIMDEKTPLAPAASVIGGARATVTRSDTLENGLTLGWRGEVRLERDAPSRPSFAGVLGACLASDVTCPRLASPGGFLSPISAATGLAAGGGVLDKEGSATIEVASLSVTGPWGEGVFGLDSGAAVRLDARAPTVLNRVSAFSPGLDPTGLSVTRARNDVTGSSLKATYMSPRWIGFRVGASYTPEANQKTADFDPQFEAAGYASAKLENVWEGAVSFARQFAEQDLRVRGAVTYSNADSKSGLAAFGQYEAWGAGLELEHDGWTSGVRWLSSNNAWESGSAGYEAWEAGLVRQVDNWRLGVEGGWAKDRLTGIEGASWLVAAGYKLTDNVDIGAGWASSEADIPVRLSPSVSHINASNDGLVLELTVRN